MKANNKIMKELEQALAELSRLKAEKLRLYPPNPHPLAEPDRYPADYTPQQIHHRNELIAQIEELEKRIEELETLKYEK